MIDGTCLVKTSRDAFLGAPLLEVDGTDHTFTYGVTRDLLRLRQALGAARFVLIFGKEAFATCHDPQTLDATAAFLQSLGVPVVNAAAYAVLDISLALLEMASHFVSESSYFLQLAQYGSEVVLVNVRRDIDIHDAGNVHAKFGVAPKLIPDLLVLTQGPRNRRLTNSQAVRLLERFGGLEELLQSLGSVKHLPAAGKLKGNEKRLREQLARLLPCRLQPEVPKNIASTCNLNTLQNREILHTRKFHSLVRMLATPELSYMRRSTSDDQRGSYKPVVDAPALEALVSAVRAATNCAIDTESTGKDPHRAELLGVSFCVKEGEAFYVPVNADDLRGIETQQVLRALKEIGQCGTFFVGQNIKYDYVLLRRYGIELSKLGFDTMLAAHECFRDWEFFNLNHLARKLLGRTVKEYKEVVKGSQSLIDVPFRVLVDYACDDADTALRLWKLLQYELQAHGVQAQFQSETMPLALTLGRWEYEGVTVDARRLQVLRHDAWIRAAGARDAIHQYFGKKFDVDSDQEVHVVLSEDSGIGEFCRGGRHTSMLLEGLSGNSLAARLFVQYWRERSVLRRIEEVLEHSHDGKVHPIFNQISSRYGQVTSRHPDLLGIHILRQVVSESVAVLYPDNKRSLNELAMLSGDHVLSGDVATGYSLEFDSLHADPGEFLLSLAVGATDSKLARKFLIELAVVSELRHRMRMRYRHAFHWLETFGTETLRLGFAQNGDRRFCAAGLKSSNIYKREQARNLCVRWILRH